MEAFVSFGLAGLIGFLIGVSLSLLGDILAATAPTTGERRSMLAADLRALRRNFLMFGRDVYREVLPRLREAAHYQARQHPKH